MGEGDVSERGRSDVTVALPHVRKRQGDREERDRDCMALSCKAFLLPKTKQKKDRD
jgi:hypothetical protein